MGKGKRGRNPKTKMGFLYLTPPSSGTRTRVWMKQQGNRLSRRLAETEINEELDEHSPYQEVRCFLLELQEDSVVFVQRGRATTWVCPKGVVGNEDLEQLVLETTEVTLLIKHPWVVTHGLKAE